MHTAKRDRYAVKKRDNAKDELHHNGAKDQIAPQMQAVPARVDFGCLPKNAQAALIQPFSGGCVAVACDRKRALSPRDVAKIRVVARRLGGRLS